MTQKTNHIKLGLFVISGLVVGLGALLWFGANSLMVEKARAYAAFNESVDGLEIGSPVKYRGVTIGSVAEIGFAPNRETVIVDIDVFYEKTRSAGLGGPGEGIPDDFAVQLASSGITGGKFLLCDLFDPKRYPRQPQPEQWPGKVDTQRVMPTVQSTLANLEDSIYTIADGLPTAITKLSQLIDQLSDLSRNVNGLTEGEIKTILNTLVEQTKAIDVAKVQDDVLALVDDMQASFENITEITATVRDNRGNIETLLVNAGTLSATLDEAVQGSDLPNTMSDLREAATSAELAADQATRVSRDVTALIEESRLGLYELTRTLASIKALSDLLERDPGALLRGRESPSPPPRNR